MTVANYGKEKYWREKALTAFSLDHSIQETLGATQEGGTKNIFNELQ